MVCQRRLGLSKTEDRRLEYYSVLEDRQDEFVVFVAQRLERGPVNNRVSTFPELFGMARVDRNPRRLGQNRGFDGD